MVLSEPSGDAWQKRVTERKEFTEVGKKLYNLVCFVENYYQDCLSYSSRLESEVGREEAMNRKILDLVLNFSIEESGDGFENSIDEFKNEIREAEDRMDFSDLDELENTNDSVKVCCHEIAKIINGHVEFKNPEQRSSKIKSIFTVFTESLSKALKEMNELIGFYRKLPS